MGRSKYISNYLNAEEPVFLGWPWLESYFDANYKNTPVDEQTKQNQLENAVFPQYTYPHANDYCAIIGGTELLVQKNGTDTFSLVIFAQELFGLLT